MCWGLHQVISVQSVCASSLLSTVAGIGEEGTYEPGPSPLPSVLSSYPATFRVWNLVYNPGCEVDGGTQGHAFFPDYLLATLNCHQL